MFKILEKILCGQYTTCNKTIFIKAKTSNIGATPWAPKRPGTTTW
jgi:hypothetical protein